MPRMGGWTPRRVLALVLVASLSLAILAIPQERIEALQRLGYPGIFLLSLAANATIVVPAPAILIVFAMGAHLSPVWLGLAAGSGAALGELSGYLQAIDIFVLPQPDGHLTRSSAFMAAAAHGLAVIAVRNVENQKDFAHGENVWLVDASRAELFAQAFRQLADDAALRARLGENLRALYARKFAWEVAAGPQSLEVRSEQSENLLEPQMNADKRR